MRIELECTDKSKRVIEAVSAFSFTQTADAACDSLRAVFFSDRAVGEIQYVRAYIGSELVFNGCCDCQKHTRDSRGERYAFFARSSACLLVDSEAQPCIYNGPSARQLCRSMTEAYGFVCMLPELYSDMSYEVQKGTSCFGAVNRFVLLRSGCGMYVTPNNEIRLREASADIQQTEKYELLSSVHCFNRSEPYRKISYKKSFSEPAYRIHTESMLAASLGISRSGYLNLSALPQWQREGDVLRKLKTSYENYETLTLKVQGYVKEPLLQRYDCRSVTGSNGLFSLAEKQYCCNENGDYTVLTLKKIVDIKEITYVD